MAEKTIMLVCSAGMSTSLLVDKMEKTAVARGIDAEIFAVSAPEADSYMKEKSIDVVLLGPQVRFMKAQFEKKLAGKEIPLAVINMEDFSMMNGEKIFEQAIKLMK